MPDLRLINSDVLQLRLRRGKLAVCAGRTIGILPEAILLEPAARNTAPAAAAAALTAFAADPEAAKVVAAAFGLVLLWRRGSRADAAVAGTRQASRHAASGARCRDGGPWSLPGSGGSRKVRHTAPSRCRSAAVWARAALHQS